MPAFHSGQDAKEYLISQIVHEAKRDRVPLSDTEHRMMYFTETAWAPEDMWEVNEDFEKNYDTPSYEAKIAALAASARSHASSTGELDTWNNAVRVLEQEDHYLLVLLAGSKISAPPHNDRSKLVGTALLVVALILIGILVFSSRR